MTCIFSVSILSFLILIIPVHSQTSHNNYVLEPSWYFDQPAMAAGVTWKQLPPIITDLDGDGSKEILLITKGLSLQVKKHTFKLSSFGLVTIFNINIALHGIALHVLTWHVYLNLSLLTNTSISYLVTSTISSIKSTQLFFLYHIYAVRLSADINRRPTRELDRGHLLSARAGLQEAVP
jgi:hypothetical protein